MEPDPKKQPHVLALDGEIDLHRVPHVRETIQPIVDGKPQRLLIDLTNVTYLDSSGLAFLIETMQRVQAYGGVFALFGLRESVKGIFHLARLDQVFKIYPNQAAATVG
jgi:anti-sigma B factor antagonist